MALVAYTNELQRVGGKTLTLTLTLIRTRTRTRTLSRNRALPHPNQVRLFKLPTEATGATLKACAQGGLCVVAAGSGAGAASGCTAARHKRATRAGHATPPRPTPPRHSPSAALYPGRPSLLTRRASSPRAQCKTQP